MIHPDDAAPLGIADGAEVVIGNRRGEVRLHARVFEGVRRGVLIAESIWPNDAYPDGRGINTVTGADAIAPYGGAAFHDNKVWIRPPDNGGALVAPYFCCRLEPQQDFGRSGRYVFDVDASDHQPNPKLWRGVQRCSSRPIHS